MASIAIQMDDGSSLQYGCEESARAALTSGVPETIEQVLKSALTVAASDAKPEPEREAEPTTPVVLCHAATSSPQFLEIVVTSAKPLNETRVVSLLADIVANAVDPATRGWVGFIWHSERDNMVLTLSARFYGEHRNPMKLQPPANIASAVRAARWSETQSLPLLVVVSCVSEVQYAENAQRASALEDGEEEKTLSNLYGWVQRRIGMTRCPMQAHKEGMPSSCFLVRFTKLTDDATSAHAAAEWVHSVLASSVPLAGTWLVKAVKSPVRRCVDVLVHAVESCARIADPSIPLLLVVDNKPMFAMRPADLRAKMQGAPFPDALAHVLGLGVSSLSRDQLDELWTAPAL